MTLRQARCEFTGCVARLILRAIQEGYEVAIDEATERLTARDPTSDHMKGSLHHIGLAVDLNLYLDAHYLTSTAHHKALGEWWEKQHPLARWGGRFGDGNHYSFEWGGKK